MKAQFRKGFPSNFVYVSVYSLRLQKLNYRFCCQGKF